MVWGIRVRSQIHQVLLPQNKEQSAGDSNQRDANEIDAAAAVLERMAGPSSYTWLEKNMA